MRRKRTIQIAIALLALVIAWFLVVDLSWFVEECPSCLERRSIAQYRIGGYAVWEQIHIDSSPIQRASADLGDLCTHPNANRWHKQRWWGLILCGCPCHNGTIGLSSDISSYNTSASQRMRKLRETRPEISAEFHKRVLVEHDYSYWRQLLEQINEIGNIRGPLERAISE